MPFRGDLPPPEAVDAAEFKPPEAPNAAPRVAALNQKRRVVLFFAAFFIVLCLDLALLDEIPWASTLDDGTYAAAGYHLVHTGRAGWAMNKGLFGLDRDFISCGRIPAVLLGSSQLLLGTTPFAARLPSLIAVGFSAVIVFALAREAALSVLLSLTAAFTWFSSIPARLLAHSSRPDAFVMLLAVSSAWLLFRALRKRNRWPMFFAGLAAGLSLEAHMVGCCLIATTAGAAFLFSAPGERLRNSLLVAVGAAPTVLLWLWIHWFSQPGLWTQQWQGLLRQWAPLPLWQGPSAVMQSAVHRYVGYFWNARYHRYLLEAPFIMAALIYAWQARRLQKSLAVLFLLFHLSLALFSSPPHVGYMAAAYPFTCILIAAAFFGAQRPIWRRAGIALLAFYGLQTGYWVIHRQAPLPESVRGDVLRHAGDAPFVTGDNLWFYFSSDPNIRSIVSINFATFQWPGLSRRAAFEKYLIQEGVQFVVADRVLEEFLESVEPRFLAERARLVHEYRYERGGWIKIYRLSLL